MRQAALNGHRATIADERLSRGQPIFDDGEQIVRQIGDVGDGLMLDLAIFTKRPAEVRRNVNLAFVRFFDFRNMHGAFVWLAHGGFVAAGKTMSRKISIFSGYTCNLIVTDLSQKPSLLPLEAQFGAVQVRYSIRMFSVSITIKACYQNGVLQPEIPAESCKGGV